MGNDGLKNSEKKNSNLLFIGLWVFLVFIMGIQSANAQTFDWESATTSDNGTTNGGKVTSTVDGITVTVSPPGIIGGQYVGMVAAGGWGGSSGNIAMASVTNIQSVTFDFTAGGPVEIQSIYAVEVGGNSGTWTYTPTGGSNSPVDDTISAGSGHTVTLNWTGVTSFTVTKSDELSGFGFDDMVLTAAATSPPTTQASNTNFSSTTSSETTVSWTRGDGENCAVFMSAASSGTASPVDDNSYTANTVFGSGSQIGASGWYCIYRGTGTSVPVLGLTESTAYRVHVCEYNGGSGAQSYLTTTAVNNPNNMTTTAKPAGTGQTTGITTPAAANGVYTKNGTLNGKQSWINSNGYNVYWVNYLSTDYWVIDADTSPVNDAAFNIESSADVPPVTGYNSPAGSSGDPLLTGFTLNAAPAISIIDASFAHTENSVATQIDAAATVSDSDGDADWNGGTLSVQVTANGEAGDEISIPDNVVGTINTSGTNIRNGATVIGTLSAAEGTVTNGNRLTVTFNSNATNALVQQALRAFHYRSTSNDPGTSNRTVTCIATDKNGEAVSDTRTITITAVNDEPTLTATGTNPVFTEDASASDLYSSVTVSAVESGQTILQLVLTVTNVNDGSDEIMTIDGSDVNLTDANSLTSPTNGMTASVSVVATTATVTISKAGGIAPASMQALVDAMTYRNTSDTPDTSNRVVTLNTIQDNGGTADGGDDTAALSIASTVTVTEHNDAPTLTSFSDVVETTTQNSEIEITFAELSAKGNEADVDGTVDAFIAKAVSTGSLNIGATSGTAPAFNVITNNTIDAANNAYWTPANNAYGSINAFTAAVVDDSGAESTGAVQAKVQVNDFTAPSVSGITISGSPSEAATSITFVAAFSEPVVNVSTDDFSLTSTGTANGTVASVSSSSGSSIDVTVNTITGTGTLRLDLDAGTDIADASANTPPAAYSSGSVHNVDRDDPALSSSVPADNATGVSASADITLTFSENIAFGTGNILIKDLDDASNITVDVTSPGTQASISNNVLTLNPSVDLFESHSYAIQVAGTAIDDIYGNSYTGILNDTDFNFDVADAIPTVAFTSTGSNGLESVGSKNLQVDISAVSGLAVTVDYTVTGTASGGGTDYTLDSGTLTINAGDPNNNITIASIVDDLLDENNETVIVTLSNPTNATLGTNTVHTYTITDNDAEPTVAFNSTGSNGLESVSGKNLQVDLSTASGLAVTVDYTVTGTATGGGTDYTLADGTLTINAGDANNNITIASIVDDLLDENGETVVVTLSNPSNAALGAQTVHTYTIIDNDNPPAIAFNTVGSSGDESVSSKNLQIDLSAVSSLTASVDYTVTGTAMGGGTDHTLTGGTLTINPGGASSNIIIAGIVDDLLDETNETVIVTLSNPINASLGSNTVHTYTITDNDAEPTVAFNSTGSNGLESVASKNLQVDLSAVSGLAVTVDYTVTGTAAGSGTDYTLAGGTLTINAGDLNNNITIAGIVDDLLDEDNETVIVTLSSPTNTTLGTNTVHIYTINDNDEAPSAAFITASQSSTGETGTMTITIQLSAPSGRDVIVPFTVNGSSTATGGGTDYTLTATPITIAAGSTKGDITITIVSDAVTESDETIVVDMGAPTNATLGAPLTHTVTIVENMPPTGADKTVSMYIDDTYGFTVSDFGFSDINAGDTLRKVQITSLPGSGLLTLSGSTVALNQEIAASDIASGNLVFIPATDAIGSPFTTFTFKVSDGRDYSAAYTMTINVTENTGGGNTLETGDTVSGDEAGINDGDTIENITVMAGGAVSNQGNINNLTNAGRVTGGTVGGNSGNSGTLEDVIIPEDGVIDNRSGTIAGSWNDGTIYGGTLSGDIHNTGVISGTAPDGSSDPDYAVTIAAGAVVTGGTLSGSIINEGELADITITEGSSIVTAPGGTFSGTITFTDGESATAVIHIPDGVTFPEAGDESVEFTFEFLRRYAEDHGWDLAASGSASALQISRLKSFGSGIQSVSETLPELPEGYTLVDGLLLSGTGSKAEALVTLSLPCRDEYLTEGITDAGLSALVYVSAESAWKRIAFARKDDGYLEITTDILSAYAVAVGPEDESEATVLLGNLSGHTSETGETASFTLALSRQPTADVTIALGVSDATEAMISPAEVTFTPENYTLIQNVTITGIDDGLVDGDVSCTIVLSPVISEDPDYSGIDPTDLSVVNTDDEIPVLLSPSGNEIGTSLTPELVIATFAATDPDFTHAVTQWQISFDPAFSDEDMVLDLTAGMVRFPVPSLVLDQGTTYFWRVKVYTEGGRASSWSRTGVFSAIVEDSGDLDGNGIPDDQAVPDTTDLDGNGIVDNDQSDIMSVTSAVGDILIGVKVGTDAEILSITAIDPDTITDTVNRPEKLEAGLLGFKVAVAPGATTDVIIYLSRAPDDDAGWYKYDPVDGWANFTEYATFRPDRKSVVLTLTDGGIGDLDGVANGTIVDLSGPDVLAEDDPDDTGTNTDTASSTNGSGGSGGCFIDLTVPGHEMNLHLLAAGLLALLLGTIVRGRGQEQR